MLCPIVNAGSKMGAVAVSCVEETCAWWIAGKKNAGSCAITRLAHYAAALLKMLPKKPAAGDEPDDDLARVDRELTHEEKP